MSIVIWPEQPAPWVEAIRQAAGPVEVRTPATEAEAIACAPSAEGWIGELTPALLAAAPKLRWLQIWSISLERYLFPELVKSRVELTNIRHTYDDHISTHVLAMLFSLCRDFPRLMRRQFEHRWLLPEKGEGVEASHIGGRVKVDIREPGDMTILIMGLGGIGAELARRLEVFGSTIIGVDPRVESKPRGVGELARPEQLPELLPRADAVIICAPQTPQTLGLFDEAMIRRMRSSAFLINVGRGKIVKLSALERALAEGWISAAALDVFETEPLPPDSPLWDNERVIVTPHVAGAGGRHTEERRIGVVVENARRFAAGEPLLYVTDKVTWI